MEQICPVCEHPFNVSPSQKRKYCSRICMSVGYASQLKGQANPNFKHGRKSCEGCGKPLARGTKGNRCSVCMYAADDYKNHFYGKKHTEETRRRMGENHLDVKGCKNSFWNKRHSEETKTVMRVVGRQRWDASTEEQKAKIANALMRGVATQRSGKYTKPEMVVAEKLDRMGIEFDHNAPLYGKFFVDFLLPDRTVIEVFGDYWHGNRAVFASLTKTQEKQKAKDRARIAYLTKCGHRVIVVWEKELKDDKDVVERRLLKQDSGLLEGS